MEGATIMFDGWPYYGILMQVPDKHPMLGVKYEAGDLLLIAQQSLGEILYSVADDDTDGLGAHAKEVADGIDYFLPDDLMAEDEPTIARFLIENY